ncbi:MAG: M1 family aminopeptidase, partial [Planctomycetota bacterium]
MFCAGGASAQIATVDHHLSVRVDPTTQRLEVRDEVTGAFGASVRFLLHRGLDPRCLTAGLTLERLAQPDLARHGINGGLAVEVEEFRVASSDGQPIERFELRYGGEIHHPIESGGEEYARSFSGSPGLIDPRGVVLSASTAWYPLVAGPDSDGDLLVTFELTVLLPEGWRSVSQGSRAETSVVGDLNFDRWSCPDPMDDIYLIAAEFTEFSRPAGGVTAMAFLRRPDPNLAAKYLETTAQYLDLYQRLIGPYPYTKFALVENFWETGYGMPSFTLLGPKIIRFPFILHSSFPHEILHNWWGNSVFVDYDSGNWCEGLTAYMADHLVKEGQGRGVEYRRDALDRFSAYVNEGRDFPLSEFRSRHSSATEAVGYGKCLMLFHMLRREVGEDRFRLGLARFNRDFAGRRASFQDIATTFTELMGSDYTPFFDQWVKRSGAPSLALEVSDDTVVLRQTQPGEPFVLRVPLALTYEGTEDASWWVIELSDRSVTVPFERDGLVRIDVDPQFDVFRRLDPSETPPTFGRLFGDPQVTIIVPARDALLGEGGAEGWRRFAESWSRTSSVESRVRVVGADTLTEWPTEGSVWVLGASNRWADRFRASLGNYGAEFDLRTDPEARLDFGVAQVATADHCFA